MSQKFLFSGENGAAVVLGATTLSFANSEELLGQYFTPEMFTPGQTVGEAMLAAKQQLAGSGAGGDLSDVLIGWTVLGDPSVIVQP